MIAVTVDNKNLLVHRGNSVLQVCELLKKDIPRFCYHKELFVAGNCRMCLVEIEKFPKPIVSCSMPAGDNMIIYTNTPLVRKARESVLEFLLINHPLDCPICDQGGECDLQDQTFLYGSDRTRFYKKHKRVVEDKYFNAIIKTVMTRCIHCTRCVRFIEQIAGESTLGTSGRGVHTEIGFYINHILKNELSGNIIDLCPVGALTSKPYAFMARPWDLTSYYSIDLNDAVHANIKIDIFRNEIVRISPKECPQINDVWISDKARFYFDGLKTQKIISCYANQIKISKDSALNFFFFLNTIFYFKNYKNTSFRFVCDDDLDLESLSLLQNLAYHFGSESIQSVASKNINFDFEFNYKFPSTFDSVEKNDFNLIISSNLRYETPNLNIKLKKNFTENNVNIAYIGNFTKNTYPLNCFGLSSSLLKKIAEGKHHLSKKLIKSKNPQIFMGDSIFEIKAEPFLMEMLTTIQSYLYRYLKKNVLNFISKKNSSINSMELGIKPFQPKKQSEMTYFINLNGHNLNIIQEMLNTKYTFYHGYLNNTYTEKSKFTFPLLNPFEKTGSYINLLGHQQISKKVINSKINHHIEFKNFLSHFKKMYFVKNHLILNLFHKFNNTFSSYHYLFIPLNKKVKQKKWHEKQIFNHTIKNFYKTNTISSNSMVMTKLTKENKNIRNFT